METRRITEKNRIRNKIREITKYIETDTNTINRLKFLNTNIEFNKNQIEKLTIKNENREELLEKLRERGEDLDNGKLDKELEEEYLETQRKIKKKENEARKKKQDLKNIKKADKEKSEAHWKSIVADSRAERFYKKDVDRGERYFFNLCGTIPDYINKKLAKMPNNKGYIWRGVYCFGKLPQDKDQKIVLYEKNRDILRIHEIYQDVVEIWEKRNSSRKVLISRTPRKLKNT